MTVIGKHQLTVKLEERSRTRSDGTRSHVVVGESPNVLHAIFTVRLNCAYYFLLFTLFKPAHMMRRINAWVVDNVKMEI